MVLNHMARATKVFDRKIKQGDLMVELVIWQLPAATPDRPHGLKYRLWCGRSGSTVVRYDNETGKGDHRRDANGETLYVFGSLEQLIEDFVADIERLTGRRIE